MTKPHFIDAGWSGPFVLPDIREAIGLDSDEKAFLYNLASHNNFTENGTVERILQRTGLGPDVFKRVRKSLRELGLITVTENPGTTWKYRLNVPALKAFPKAYFSSTEDASTRRAAVAAKMAERRNTSATGQAPLPKSTPSHPRSGKKNTGIDKYARPWSRQPKEEVLDTRDEQPEQPTNLQDHEVNEGWYEAETETMLSHAPYKARPE